MILKRVPAAVCSLCLLATSACGGDDGSNGATASSGVVATTSIWADIASATLCGADVPAVIPAGADAHSFEPSLRDRELLDDAAVVIANGGGLEATMADLLGTVAADDTTLVELLPFVDTIVLDEPHDHDDDDTHEDDTHDLTHDDDTHEDDTHEDDEHGHDLAVDPHVWQDPRRVRSALPTIASAGAPLGLGDCSAAYDAELAELDTDIVEILAAVPDDRRRLVTSHESLNYFADRYGFEVVGTVIGSTSTLAETNAADLAALADAIAAEGVPAVFTEALESTVDADALAERLGVEVVPLVTDALTEDTDTYLEMMRTNAERIADALAP